jgi:hypothetical protein
MRRFYAYLDWKVKIPRIRHGEKSSIETLISEEVLLSGMCLRNEERDLIPWVGIVDYHKLANVLFNFLARKTEKG